MKYFISKVGCLCVILFLLLLPEKGATQETEWGVEGSYYIYRVVALSAINYQQFLFSNDTLINGEVARTVKVFRIFYSGFDNPIRELEEYMYSIYLRNVGDSIYLWNEGEFQFVYDLSPTVGDAWTIQGNDLWDCSQDPIPNQDAIHLTDSGTYSFLGQEYSTFTMSSENEHWSMGERFFTGIGPGTSFLPQPGNAACTGIDSGVGLLSRIVCYFHPSIGWLHLGEQNPPDDCENLAVSVEGISAGRLDVAFNIYPNPISGEQLFLVLPGSDTTLSVDWEVRIYDVAGRIQQQYHFVDQALDVSGLAKGVYFVSLYREGYHLGTKKIIK